MKPMLVVREAAASAWAEKVATTLTILLVAGLCLSVLMTTGRTVGAERQVLTTLDAAGTRTIVVRAEPDAMVTSDAVDRIAAIEDVEWAGAFGPAVDVRNAAIRESIAVPSRQFWSTDPSILMADRTTVIDPSLYLSTSAARDLGLPDAVGEVQTNSGLTLPVVGGVDLPPFLAFMDPVAVRPADDRGPVALIVVVVADVSDVAVVTPIIRAALMPYDASKLSITTSDDLARIQQVLGGQLSGYGRSLVLGILLALGAMVAALMYGLVMIRRRDFGRRRALGASQAFIVALVVTRTTLSAVIGAVLGILTGLGLTVILGDPLPGPAFTASLALLAVAVSVVAALAPAVVASRREPLVELRVP